jgi:glucosamine--fructose-6-phosphate aminotransferase (isomerizing)
MCGIVGYTGPRTAIDIILDGLKRLEYRGYDSVGVALTSDGKIFSEKDKGNIASVEKRIRATNMPGNCGIGHTRWATHGKPSRTNAHPHFDCTGNIAVVHNGIIENFHDLKEELLRSGHKFTSETDTEVIPHLIEKHYEADLLKAVISSVKLLQGSYAIAVAAAESPEIIAARLKSPLVIGIGKGENFIASDVPAILPYTRQVIYLQDTDVAVISPQTVRIYDSSGNSVSRKVATVQWQQEEAEKGGYQHFMLKEIYEQPQALKNTLDSIIDSRSCQIRFPHLEISDDLLRETEHLSLVACGTAYHAAIVGKYSFNELVKVPVIAEPASEFRYSPPHINARTLLVAISQSGETADTLAAVEEAKKCGAKVLAICNVTGSSLARASDGIIYTRAGPEIGVASTKAYTTQLAAVIALALHLSELKGKIPKNAQEVILCDLLGIPDAVEEALKLEPQIMEIAEKFKDTTTFLYIGRHYNFATAFEGALKLKEISYIHAEGYGAGEMKHGPIALVQPTYPTVAIATRGTVREKMLSNIQEIKARGGPVIALANPDDREVKELTDHTIEVPEVKEILSPIVNIIPLQLLAYHIAVAKGYNVDQPRNLAKSVTVE